MFECHRSGISPLSWSLRLICSQSYYGIAREPNFDGKRRSAVWSYRPLHIYGVVRLHAPAGGAAASRPRLIRGASVSANNAARCVGAVVGRRASVPRVSQRPARTHGVPVISGGYIGRARAGIGGGGGIGAVVGRMVGKRPRRRGIEPVFVCVCAHVQVLPSFAARGAFAVGVGRRRLRRLVA